MSPIACFLLAVLIILSVCVFLSRRGGRQDFDEEAHGSAQEISSASGWDSLTSDLSARIFDSEDSDFVASTAARQVTRQFRRERSALALDWLRTVRGLVNEAMRAHLRSSRGSDGLKPADELKVWFDFLLFQLTSGILYFVIWICGPPRAAKLVGYSSGLAGKLRHVAEDALPVGRQVVAELLDNRQDPKNGSAV